MADPFCTLMGIADIVAEILILIGFGMNTLAIVFAMIMIIKGGISFV